MARIRTIKPDFWTDGTMIGLSFEARLFYIGTWNFALCDHGHLPDDPIGLKLKILPADPVDARTLVGDLLDAGRLVRIAIPDGRTFLHILRFEDHQKVDLRWQSRCPVCTYLAETHASSGEAQGDSQDFAATRLGGEGKGKESKGREDASASQSALPPVDNSEPALRCPAHAGTPVPPKCGQCKDARVAHETWATAQAAAARAVKPSAWRPGLCRDHLQNADTCEMCAYENAHAAEIITGRFGAAS